MNIELTMQAFQATECLLNKQPVTVTHPAGWERPANWPLPIKREAPSPDGRVTQNYRPLAILEFVAESLA